MILAALLLLQTAPAPVPADDIVVIGQRLQKNFKASVKFGKDGARCRISRSTGDVEIDRIGCTAIETCFPQYQSRYHATRDRAIRPDVRKVMQAALNQELSSCMSAQYKAGTAALAAKRKGA